EKLSRIAQAKYRKEQILDNIELQVKEAYLRTKESEKNITTVEKAIEQARENLRITEERFKEQVSTATDVLVAQTLLVETMTNYYNALYDYKIAKAVLYRAIGQEVLE
ncbi:MAG: TolC family protein, partial [Desulfobacterales bacterium]